ncbi:chromosomal replication initiator protein DnaA [Nocardioides iriomotensis]|uniref:Chromosomal replication initiator protein DnaA n=1 Tax=Nocardioides iriomotensis TaxID=715784 RepID=A0A4Q5IWD9_9ACTN|nr:chromosomal replication initiator protein DnaA [Nocardioides iriomotensis]RYU10364.1 chromosomal replication initiator protein DnaA [Nocardioides iriomotensis]
MSTVWRTLIDDLPPSQRAWLAASRPVTLHEHTAIVAVADDFTRNQLEGRLRTRLEDALGHAFGTQVRIAVTVDPELEAASPHPATPPSPVASAAGGRDAGDGGAPAPLGDELDTGYDTGSINPSIDLSTNPLDVPTPFGATAPKPAGTALETRLNPKYVFETFVIGSSNRFAHAAAVAVAEAPGKAYNPLLIYGDSGLGKTHLLHAIGHYVRSLFNGARVRYVSSEEFTNEFINAIRDDKAAMFQRRYRDVDVLLIDDIQFLEGKIQTQEEFFHTFNTLHNANKQIVITSDRAPKRLEALEDRLRNRFEWGLITDVQPPDLETRIAILRKKAATERMTAPPDVLEFIASKIQTNIRELEGALIRVTAFASLNRQPVDLTLAEIVLKDLIPEGGEPEISAALIIAQTAAYFGLSIDDLCGSSRSRVLVTGRQIAMYLCRELTDLSLPKIGQQFGGRDHTTVMHADKKIRQLLAERRSVYNQVTELTNRIKQQARQS